MTHGQDIWADWTALIKRVVARFARGNIAAQRGRVHLPKEQERERAEAKQTATAWKRRADAVPRS
jgi:hypothetical protein